MSSEEVVACAQQLGLRQQGDTVWGTLHGVPVNGTVLARMTSVGGLFAATARASLPLDMGLCVRAREPYLFSDELQPNALSALVIPVPAFMVLGGQKVSVGDAALDQAFNVWADEPHRAATLLRTPEVRALLMETQERLVTPFSSAALNLSDHGVELRHSIQYGELGRQGSWLVGADKYAANIDLTARLAAAVRHAQPSVPVASRLAEHREIWKAFAQTHGLKGGDTPLCLWGVIDGVHVQAYVCRTHAFGYELSVHLRLEEPLGIGLLAWGRHQQGQWFGNQDGRDVLLGDAVFDREFFLQVGDLAEGQRLLGPAVRQQLLELNQAVGPIVVRDDGIEARVNQFTDPRAVPELVRRATATLEALSRARRGLDRGPFR